MKLMVKLILILVILQDLKLMLILINLQDPKLILIQAINIQDLTQLPLIVMELIKALLLLHLKQHMAITDRHLQLYNKVIKLIKVMIKTIIKLTMSNMNIITNKIIIMKIVEISSKLY